MTAPTLAGTRTALLLVARHAPVEAPGVCYGRSDLEPVLPDEQTVDGIVTAFARAAAPFERAMRVWSSPLVRCARPAALLARRLGVPHVVDERLHELSFGAWERRRYDDLAHEDPQALARFFDGWDSGAAAPGGEGIFELERRVRTWSDELGEGVQIVVAHAGVVRALRVIVRGDTWQAAMSSAVEPLAVDAFRWEVA